MGYQVDYSARTFSKGTKALAFYRAKGRCTECGVGLAPGNIRYDHRIPWAICRHSGPSNCQVLCRNCHDIKTATRDIPDIARGSRVHNRHIGAAGPGLGRHPMRGGRRDGISRTFSHGVQRRLTQAERHAAFVAARALNAADGTAVGVWAPDPPQAEH
jgi:hypothetical protein